MAKVLFVDDELARMRPWMEALRGAGNEVFCCSAPSAAIAHLRAFTVDVAILDMVMPTTEGLLGADFDYGTRTGVYLARALLDIDSSLQIVFFSNVPDAALRESLQLIPGMRFYGKRELPPRHLCQLVEELTKRSDGRTNLRNERGKWLMAGTEGTFGYNVVAISESGRLGYRMLSDGRVRIRIEPSSMSSSAAIGMSLPKEQGWKQPGDDGQDRFSVVVDRNLLSFMLSKAISGLLESGSAVELHPEAPGWLRTVMEHARCHEVSATGSPAEKVEHFLLQSFNSFELKRFVCRNFEVLSHEIQFDGKPIGEATFDLVQALQRHGLLNAKLVSALKEARPNKAYELDRLGLS